MPDSATPDIRLESTAEYLIAPSLSLNSFDQINELCSTFLKEWEHDRPDLKSYLSRVTEEDRPTLLRNLLEIEVRMRRRSGEAPSAHEYIARLPESEGMIRRIFLDASSVSMSAVHEPTQGDTLIPAPSASRLGDYRLVRELGRGGMGAVFEAVHLGRGHRVALKTLPAVSGDSLHRFKREFRVLSDVTHPNLVGLHTLENDGGQWFITLDLLEGSDFLSYVRPRDRMDESRLRACLGQLVTGLMALHGRSVVHRDLKPGNVIVTTTGRVVILDFGLVAEWGQIGNASNAGVTGTPAYMAPEQAAGGQIGPPADWYAVGVMLFEALTGRRPFGGDIWRMLSDKQHQDAPPIPADPTIPSDLADLCIRLLARNPATRPDPLQIAGTVAASAHVTIGSMTSADQLIGRESQFAALTDALVSFRREMSPLTLFINGRSGEGKTSLAEHFLAPLRKDNSLVVMSGRCYDRESVPFKALDTLVDALTSYLRSLPDSDAALLLPDDIGLLAEVFPVLRRCEVVARAPRGRLDALDQQQIRQRAFAAMRLLLDRIGERTPVIWFIDDLQWGDGDSAGALFEVLRPPAAPPVFFLGSFRSDEADASPFLTEWSGQQKKNGIEFSDQTVTVGPLSLEESTQLVVNLLERDDDIVRRRAVQFHAQTGGNPFLLTELTGCFDPDADAFHATDIHGVLAQKLEQLPSEAGPLLDAVSVSGQAVDLAEAAVAAGLTESPEDTLTRMRNMRLLRVVGEKVDTYHDRIRYAVLDRMDENRRKSTHRSLANVIERTAGGLTDEEIDAMVDGRADARWRESLARVYDLAYHFDAAGEQRQALAYGLLAATQARAQFAIDVAAQQYALAQRNADNSPKTVRFRLARGKGESLIQMGCYEEAKRELDTASALAELPYEIADACGLHGELASKLGLIAESVEYFENGIRMLGTHVPRTGIGRCWGILKETAVQVVHCCLTFRLNRGSLNEESDLSNHLLARLEWSLYCHNVMNLVWASLIGLNQAERLPRSKALAINYVVHANDMAVLGWQGRAEKYYRKAIELSNELNDQWGAALGQSHFALGCLGAGRYEEAVAMAEPGKIAFTKLGDLLELHGSYVFTSIGTYGLGNLAEVLRHSKWLFDSCVRHGDQYFAVWAVYSLARCTRGRLPIDELINCVRILPGNNLSAATALMAEGHWHTYHGRTVEALLACEQAWMVCWSNLYIVTFNSNVLCQLVTALRLRAEALESKGSAEADGVRRRANKMAKWTNRLSWFLPPERPHALRELSLAYAHSGKTKTAWRLAAKSCQKAEAMKARYEYAKSLLVQGQLAKQLGRPEADSQIQQATAMIQQIENAIDAVLK
jgi:serine/threonine protein kinase/tetratricopeptide (TPR) repeat protein